MHRVDAFIEAFRYKREAGVEKWRFIFDNPVGDCEDFARTVAQLHAHGRLNMLDQMDDREIKFFLCWSPSNGWVPRHTIVWVKGRGYIDSTRREFRPGPNPHKIAFRWPNWLVRRMLR